MNRYVGDFTPGKTIRLVFNTNKADGTPITLAGTPAVAVYKDASTTEGTAGVALTVDFDARTGLHQVAIDTSADGTFYSAGSDFRAVLTAGTVDSISVVGVVVGGFSLANRSALRPATADRTIAVDASGKAPATLAAADVSGNVPADAKAINAVSTSGVTTVGANVGTTQPLNFTGTGASALVKGDTIDVGGITADPADGTVAAATSSTITLDSTDPNVGNVVAGTKFKIISGTGASSTVYTLGTNVSGNQWNVSPAWSSGTPDTTSKYQYVGLIMARAVTVSDKTGYTASTVTDKTGYALVQSFPTNFANLSLDTSGRVNVGKWLDQAVSLDGNSFPNVNARDWGGSAVSGGLPNTATPPTAAAIRAEIDANSTKLDVAVGTRLAGSVYVAPDNTTLAQLATALQSDGSTGFQFTVTALANAPTGSGGGTGDWSVIEKEQIRYRLGIDGATAAPAAGPTLPVTLSDKTGMKLASDGLDAITVETGVNARQALSPILAAAAGVLSGAGTGSISIKAGNNPATTRVTAVTDSAGNRTTVTLVLPS